MDAPPPGKGERIARLLGELADLSSEEEALAAYRREAEAFDAAASTAGIEAALRVLEKEAEP